MEWVDWIGNSEWQLSQDAVPMVPTVAREVLDFSTDPDVPARRVVTVVGKDQVLATRVLQLANSAYSASAVEITSINDAVLRLGTGPVRNVVTAVCVASILADKGAYGNSARDLVDHGIGTAYLGWLLADRTGASREEAFVCGLLHDIGKLLVHQLAHKLPSGVKKPSGPEVSAIMTERHAEFGAHLLRFWHLPQALSDAVANHHHPDTGVSASTTVVAYAANRLAHHCGFGCVAEEFDPETDPVFSSMALGPDTLALIEKQARKMYEAGRHLSA
jgi:putative nucleotidyltransferase with HDIG domain